jgi:acyl-homoserine lactone acylase PvdQ
MLHFDRSKIVGLMTALLLGACVEPTEQPPAGIEISQAAPGSVNIYRDSFGVPHLYAELEEDAFWGHGYTAAEDHLEGTLVFYLSLKGELAKAFGAGTVDLTTVGVRSLPPDVDLPLGEIGDTVASDLDARRWRHLEDARLNFSALDPQLQRNMEAYIDGFEQYMADHPELVPEWAPALEPALPLAAASSIMLSDSYQSCSAAIAGAEDTSSAMEGSNVWAFPADRMQESAAVFLSDSHGPIEWPYGTFLSPTRIHGGAMDAWLLDVPGMVLAIKGHSRDYAWGWAEGPRRPSDCIVLQTEEDDPTTYLYDGEPQRMQLQPYTIEVKDEAAQNGVFEYTHHNGVLSPVVHRNGTTAYAVSASYMQRAGFSHQQLREMLLATDHESMRTALAQVEIYPANLIFAGSDGSITYIRPGRIPKRPEGFDGSQPVDGNSSAGAWSGIHPIEKLVQSRNPQQKYLVNNNVSPDKMFRDPVFLASDYPPDFAFDGWTGSRQRRAIDLFEGVRKFSFEDALAFARDAFVMGSDSWGEALRQAMQENPDLLERQDAGFAGFLESLAGFDGHFSAGSRGALYHALVRERLRAGEEETATAIESALNQRQGLDDQQKRHLFSLAIEAYEEVRDRLGGLDKTFGDVYRIGRGGVSAPSRGFSLGPLAGDPANTIAIPLWSAGYTPPDEDGYRWSGGGTRHPFVVQFTQPIRSVSVAVYGASDDPNSPHFSDQSALVADKGLHSNFFEPSELAHAVTSVQTLTTSGHSR